MAQASSGPTKSVLDLLPAGGEMGERIRAFDWAATDLGPPGQWPGSLRFALSLCLGSSFPSALYCGPDLRVIYNDAWAPIPADRHPGALGRPAAELWPDIWEVIAPQFRQVIETGEGFAAFEQMLPIVRDGMVATTYWNYSFSPIFDRDGKVIAIFNQGHEITGRVLAEKRQALRLDLYERLRDLVDPAEIINAVAELLGRHTGAMRVGYAEPSPEGAEIHVQTDWTDGAHSLAGRKRDLRGFGTEIADLLHAGKTLVVNDRLTDPRTSHPDVAAAWAATDIRSILSVPLVKQGALVSILYVHLAEPRAWIEQEIALVEEVAERTWAAIERASAQRALRESEQKLSDEQVVLAALVEHLPVGIIVTDREGDTVLCNPAYLRIVPEGVLPSKLPNVKERWLSHGTSRAPTRPDQFVGARVLNGETVPGSEFLFRIADGTPSWLRVGGVPLRDAAGAVSGALLVVVDVDAHKRTEQELRELTETLEERVSARTNELIRAQEALRQSQKLESMGQLTGGVAHDFNNLLTPILGSLDLLKIKGLGSERDQRLIDGALQSAERARTLVQRLLAFARRQPLEIEPVDIGDVVAGLVELIESTVGPRVRLDLAITDRLPPARADANQLEMAILNLAVNARDAMPNGGRLGIAAALEAIAPGVEGSPAPLGYIHLSVTDTGTGMDEATLARAIEPFFSTKGIGKGTGLGLSMVHGLATQLDGAFALSSKPGVGTRVDLWLPVSEEMPAARDDDGEDGPADMLGIVLLVDDEDIVRSTTADMLIDLGYAVIEASSAIEALRLIDEGLKPHLLLTDHLMPGMTGSELILKLRQRCLPIPALLISGYADRSDLGADLPRLTKPFRRDELANALKAVMASTLG